MTPEERNLVSDLFGRLAAVENSPRDPDAERIIRDGLRQAPNAIYALVQTTLLQDEALKRADERIRALEAQAANSSQQHSGSFLGGGRDSVWGRPGAPRTGSVPSVRPADTGAPAGNAPVPPPGYAPAPPPGYAPAPPQGYAPAPPPGYAPAAPARGGSFLGTAAAAAAGAIGGSLLMNSMRSMMGGPGHAAGSFGGAAQAASSGSPSGTDTGGPWSSAGGGNLARDAGVDDIGRTPSSRSDSGTGREQGIVGGDSGNAPNSDDAQYDDGLQFNDDTQVAGGEEQENVQEAQDFAEFEDDGSAGLDGGGGDDE